MRFIFLHENVVVDILVIKLKRHFALKSKEL